LKGTLVSPGILQDPFPECDASALDQTGENDAPDCCAGFRANVDVCLLGDGKQ
jgi:hypothetical protein